MIVSNYSSLMLWNLKLYNNSFEWKNVTFWWGGSKHTLALLHIFRGSWSPTPRIYAPCGSGICFRESATSAFHRSGPQRSSILGFSLTYAYTLRIMRKFGVVAHGVRAYLEVAYTLRITRKFGVVAHGLRAYFQIFGGQSTSPLLISQMRSSAARLLVLDSTHTLNLPIPATSQTKRIAIFRSRSDV